MSHQNRKHHHKAKKLTNLDELKTKAFLQEIKIQVLNEELEKLVQIIPKDLMAALIKAISTKGTSLQEEVLLRLVATVIEGKAFRINPRLDQMLANKLNNYAQAKLENEMCRRGWGYLYEKEKLKLLLIHERLLPKDYEENFLYLDPKKEAKALRKEQRQRDQEEKKKNKGSEEE